MRHFVTLGRVGNSDVWEMIYGPETPYDIHRVNIKELKGALTHQRYSEVQLWGSSGGVETRVQLTGYSTEPVPDGRPIISGVVNEPDTVTPDAEPEPEPAPPPPAAPVVATEADGDDDTAGFVVKKTKRPK